MHSERGKKTRQTEEEVGRQHQGMDRLELCKYQWTVENREKWRKLVAKSSPLLTVKGLMMMMMMNCSMKFPVFRNGEKKKSKKKNQNMLENCPPSASKSLWKKEKKKPFM